VRDWAAGGRQRRSRMSTTRSAGMRPSRRLQQVKGPEAQASFPTMWSMVFPLVAGKQAGVASPEHRAFACAGVVGRWIKGSWVACARIGDRHALLQRIHCFLHGTLLACADANTRASQLRGYPVAASFKLLAQVDGHLLGVATVSLCANLVFFVYR